MPHELSLALLASILEAHAGLGEAQELFALGWIDRPRLHRAADRLAAALDRAVETSGNNFCTLPLDDCR